MPTLSDWELWAVAAKVLDAEGDAVGEFLVERINHLNDLGDHDGVAMWLAVAERVQRLHQTPVDPKDLH